MFNLGSMLKSKASSKSFKKRMSELKKVSTRIEARMAKLEKIVTALSKSLQRESVEEPQSKISY